MTTLLVDFRVECRPTHWWTFDSSHATATAATLYVDRMVAKYPDRDWRVVRMETIRMVMRSMEMKSL